VSVYAELADGRRLEFPDGTDPAVMQATVKKVLGAVQPADSAVAVNAANKGLAGIPDALLNTPTNVINLGKAAFGTGAAALGRPDLAPEPSAPPNYASKAMRAMGMTSEANEPTNAKQRIIDMMMQGGMGMLVNPAKSAGGLIKNVVAGEAGGAAGGATKELTGSDALATTAALLTPLAPAAANRAIVGVPRPMNAVKAKTLADSREAGYVIPGSETNTGFVNRRLEDFGGKAAIKQEADLRNQRTTDRLAVEELGLPKDTAITPGTLRAFREDVAEPYREVASLSPVAASALDRLKQARADATAHYKHYDRQADPEALAKAKQFSEQADMLETALEKIASRAKKPELIEQLRDARQKIAKSYDIERALNKGDASVSATDVGHMLDKGKPLSGSLGTIGRFAEAFPRYATEGAKVPPPDVSKTNAVAAAMLGTAGFTAGGPWGLAAAGIPYLSNPTRSMLLSKPYQRMLTESGKKPTEAAMRALMLARIIAEREGGR
jgi:hypothetical protein